VDGRIHPRAVEESGHGDDNANLCAARADSTAMTNEYDALELAVRAFLLRWEVVRPHISGAFLFAAAHGSRYEGPTIDRELESLRRALYALEAARAR